MTFLGCGPDHHSLAFTTFGGNAINHVAFEVPTIEGMVRGVERVERSGYPMQWGIGRHGPGDNIFAYFLDERDFAIEYTAEMQQVDDATYVGKTPEEWARRGQPDLDWTACRPATPRFDRAIGAPTRPAPVRQPASDSS